MKRLPTLLLLLLFSSASPLATARSTPLGAVQEGEIALERGRFAEAVAAFQRSASATPRREERFSAQLKIAMAYRQLGQPWGAEAALIRAKRLAQSPSEALRCTIEEAALALSERRARAALALLEELSTDRLETLPAADRVRYWMRRSLAEREIDRVDAARRAAIRAVEAASHSGVDPTLAALAHIALEQVTPVGTTAPGDERGPLQRAEALLTSAPISFQNAMAWHRLGEAASDRDRSAAKRAMQRVITLGEQLNNPRLRSLGHGGVAQIAESEAYARISHPLTTAVVNPPAAAGGLPSERIVKASRESALREGRRALFFAQACGDPDLLFRWHWLMARLLREQGESDTALRLYRQAVQLEPGSSRGKVVFSQGDRAVYTELLDLLLTRATAQPAQADALRFEARATLERLKAAELNDYFRDDCVDAFLARRQGLEQLDAGTAVLYPIFLSDRVELLLGVADRLHSIRVQRSPSQLDALVTDLRALLEKRTTYQYLAPAQQLYDLLIRPLEPLLAGVETLVFAPDGSLRQIPLAALHDGERHLMERFALVTSPGLNLTEAPLDMESSSELLATGLSESRLGYSPLPHVRQELAALDRDHDATVLIDAEFRTDVLNQTLQQHGFDWLHIASHGRFEPDSGDSFLLTYDQRLNLDDLDRLLRPHRLRSDPIDMLTLSACQTAVGDERAALGLAGIAVKSGARSALATLWLVSDVAASELVTRFYQELLQGERNKARALAVAQRALAEGRFRHPSYWSSFVLIGSWQ